MDESLRRRPPPRRVFPYWALNARLSHGPRRCPSARPIWDTEATLGNPIHGDLSQTVTRFLALSSLARAVLRSLRVGHRLAPSWRSAARHGFVALARRLRRARVRRDTLARDTRLEDVLRSAACCRATGPTGIPAPSPAGGRSQRSRSSSSVSCPRRATKGGSGGVSARGERYPSRPSAPRSGPGSRWRLRARGAMTARWRLSGARLGSVRRLPSSAGRRSRSWRRSRSRRSRGSTWVASIRARGGVDALSSEPERCGLYLGRWALDDRRRRRPSPELRARRGGRGSGRRRDPAARARGGSLGDRGAWARAPDARRPRALATSDCVRARRDWKRRTFHDPRVPSRRCCARIRAGRPPPTTLAARRRRKQVSCGCMAPEPEYPG